MTPATRRPSFADCHREAASWGTRTPITDEITSILRALAHGSDPRTCRVLRSGAVVGVGDAGKEEAAP